MLKSKKPRPPINPVSRMEMGELAKVDPEAAAYIDDVADWLLSFTQQLYSEYEKGLAHGGGIDLARGAAADLVIFISERLGIKC